jgi:hypothetical protein
MPFRVKNRPPTFQKAITKTLKKYLDKLYENILG